MRTDSPPIPLSPDARDRPTNSWQVRSPSYLWRSSLLEYRPPVLRSSKLMAITTSQWCLASSSSSAIKSRVPLIVLSHQASRRDEVYRVRCVRERCCQFFRARSFKLASGLRFVGLTTAFARRVHVEPAPGLRCRRPGAGSTTNHSLGCGGPGVCCRPPGSRTARGSWAELCELAPGVGWRRRGDQERGDRQRQCLRPVIRVERPRCMLPWECLCCWGQLWGQLSRCCRISFTF